MHVDTGICLIFLYDFFHRLFKSNDKLRYMRWAWIDVISSIPAFPLLRVGRAVRIVRVLRLLRGVRSVKTIEGTLFANLAKGTLASAFFACTLLVVFSSLAILHVETDATSNIKSADDALWWAVETVTTVGYGDRFPTTTEGRLIGVALMSAGVGLFAVLAAAFAAWFLTPDGSKKKTEVDVADRLDLIAQELSAIRMHLENRETERVKDETV